MSATRRVVALFRKASYSPNQHRTNDTAILEETLARIVARGWTASRLDETEIEAAIDRDTGLVRSELIPPAELYLNMCQGARASVALHKLESSGACVLNPPSSVLACHRHLLVPAMHAAGVPFPDTLILECHPEPSSSASRSRKPRSLVADAPRDNIVRAALEAGEPIWIKRGDVHAERTEDVVAVPATDVVRAIDVFRARGITRISLQRHVTGPVVKFYGTADGRFFRFYDASAGPNGATPTVDVERLRAIAFAAAAAVGVFIFGGDAVIRSPNDPVLIDLNDWPSFAPFRDAAADHIAEFALARAQQHSHQQQIQRPYALLDDTATLVQ